MGGQEADEVPFPLVCDFIGEKLLASWVGMRFYIKLLNVFFFSLEGLKRCSELLAHILVGLGWYDKIRACTEKMNAKATLLLCKGDGTT